MSAIENLTATTLRNIIGELELDQSLTSRDIINARMRSILDEATDPWGIKVNRVELKNIVPPKDIQNAMEKQMRAEQGTAGADPSGRGPEAKPDPGGPGREGVYDPPGRRRKAGPHHGGRSRSCCHSPGERGHGRLFETPQ